MSDLIDRQAKSIPYEEYRLTFDHIMHTKDGDTVLIGFPLLCKMCVSTDLDKRFVVMNLERLFEEMHEAVMREEQDG